MRRWFLGDWARPRLVIPAALLVLVAGCGIGADEHTAARVDLDSLIPPGSVALAGWVTADGPVEGATVELFDRDGNLLGQAMAPTNPNGLWTAVIDEAPEYLRMVARGGKDADGKLDAELVAVEDPFSSDVTPHIGPASTLLAAWLDENPEQSFDEGRRRVAALLELPADWDVNGDTRVPFDGFSGAQMVREVRRNGGLEPFLKTLLVKLEAGDSHAFPSPPANQSTNPAAAIGIQILKSALSAVLSEIVRQAENGGGQPNLADISSQLGYVTGQVNSILNSLSTIESKLDLVDYDTRTSSSDMQKIVLYSGQAFAKLTAVSDAYHNHPNPSAAEMAAAKVAGQAFVDYFNSDVDRRIIFADGPDLLDQVTQGTEGNTGALALWTRSHSQYTRLWSAASQARAGRAVAYWAGIQAQLLASNYAYAQATPNSSFDVARWQQEYPAPPGWDWTGKWADWLQAAGLAGMRPIQDGKVLDRATNTVWWPDVPAREPTTYNLNIALNRQPGMQAPTFPQLNALLDQQGTYSGWKAARRIDGSAYPTPAAWLADNGFGNWIKTAPTTCDSSHVPCTPNQWAYTSSGAQVLAQYQYHGENCVSINGANQNSKNCYNKTVDLATAKMEEVCVYNCPKAYEKRNRTENKGPNGVVWQAAVNFLLQQPYDASMHYVPSL